jgi:Spy/CpxP family protein refolding chaperone
MPRPRFPRPFARLVLALVVPAAWPHGLAAAQEHAGASPYADLEDREIKSLSAEEVAGLLAGDGIGFALPAELNGVPGPKHVLELADSLVLTAEQRGGVEAIEGEMRRRAIELGADLIEAERALDRLFARGGATADDVRAALATAEDLRAALREAHLLAHLSTAALLTPDQIARYRHLRGYHAH